MRGREQEKPGEQQHAAADEEQQQENDRVGPEMVAGEPDRADRGIRDEEDEKKKGHHQYGPPPHSACRS